MRKQLTVALGLAVLATPAFATKARLEALGEDNYGSYFLNDNRNIFLNPAKINDNKDLATFEFGANSTANNGSVTGTQTDSVASPRAEGGLIKSYGNLVYGVHMGNSTPTAAITRTLGSITNAQEVKPIDLFVGGDAGVKWGANVTYEDFTNGNVNGSLISSHALRTRLGVVHGDLEAFVQASLSGNVKNRTTAKEVDGKGSYFAGVGYNLNGTKLFADWKSIKADYGVQGTTDSNFKMDEIRLGAARNDKISDKASLITKAQLTRGIYEDDSATALSSSFSTIDGKITQYSLPLTAGVEYAATSWLDLRTSVSQTVWSQQEQKPTSGTKTNRQIASTVVRAGASLKFGELSIDGVISTSDGGASPAAGTGADTANGKGTLRTDMLMSRVSMTYRF
ncbi:MAG: hypothetical protein AB7I27_15000 [Bacteriovoracaceae bacterium]